MPAPPASSVAGLPPASNPSFQLTTLPPAYSPSSMEKKTYSKLGRVTYFQANPSVVHFGGYQVGETSTVTLRLTNVGPVAKRMHIIPPTTPFYKLRYAKLGVVAPGMSQIIKVDFMPTEWRYYYDCIRINCEGDEGDEGGEGDNLLVPLHGYPVINEVIFPTKISFRNCYVSELVVQSHFIECKVPIQFEYEFTVIKQDPCFWVRPMKGVIESGGKTRIDVGFEPGLYGTFEAVIQINVSQFNFQPFTCTITGSSSPGKHRQRQLAKSALALSSDFGPTLGAPLAISSALGHTYGTAGSRMAANNIGPELLETYDRGVPKAAPRGKGSGAVNDAGAEWYTGMMLKKNLATREDPGPAPPLPESVVEGLRFPGDMQGQAGLNYILTQTAGKLKPKDLKEAIRKQREFRATQKREQEEARARTAGGQGGNNSDPAEAGVFSVQAVLAAEFNNMDTRQIKEMAFLQDIQELDKMEKEREFKSSVVFLGETLMTDGHIGQIQQGRQEATEDMEFNKRQEERMRSTDHFMSPYEVPARYGRALTEVGATEELIKIHNPTFDVYKNDLWKKRKKQLARLVFLTGQWITRRRVERRLTAIRAKIGDLSSEEVKELVELDFQQASNNNTGDHKKKKTEAEIEKEKQEKETDEVKRKKKMEEPFAVEEEFVVRSTVPMFEEDESFERMPETIVQKPLGFLDLPMSTLRGGVESVEHGYTEVAFPQIDLYIPMEETRQIRVGAFEEYGVRPERDQGDDWAKELVEGGKVEVAAEPDFPAKGKSPKKDSPRAALDDSDKNEGQAFLDDLLKHSVDLEKTACLPVSFKTTVIPPNLNLLRHDNSVRVYAPVDKLAQETDRSWDVRPKFIPREIPESIGRLYSEKVGTSTLHAHRNIETISTTWRPRRERKVTCLEALAVNTRQSLWECKDLPPVQSRHVEDDNMSDSESEGEVDPVFIPTVRGARTFFSKDGGEKASVGDDEEDDKERETVQVMRDRKMLELARRQREERCRLASRLPDRMKRINDKIVNPKHLMFLQTPFHRLQIQYPALGDTGKPGDGGEAQEAETQEAQEEPVD